MKVIDNINSSVKTDLLSSVKEGSRLAIAASSFSIYVYKELKAELEKIEELRFIFTAPTFIAEKSPKDSREYYVPRLDRERNLYGSDYEIKLRNELSQKTIAKECAEWIRRKVVFKSNTTRSIMTATGDDNILSDEEKMDLEYRKQQLERLQNEVVDIEDMSTGISIMDLGLNEFRLDLLAYIKDKPNLDRVPYGIEAVIASDKDNQRGVVYVLKNRSNSVNIDNKNRLHPFYVVYISDSGEVLINHLEPKEALDEMRLLCKGKVMPDKKVCAIFNKDTREGRNMKHYSSLLGKTVASIVDVKEESDINSFLSGDNISFKSSTISGLDDFELICFLIIK